MNRYDFLKDIANRKEIWGTFNNNIATNAQMPSLTIDKSFIDVAMEASVVIAELVDGTTKVLKNSNGKLEGYSIISDERLEELAEAEEKLAALEAAGVDNWDGYEFAMADLYEQVKEF